MWRRSAGVVGDAVGVGVAEMPKSGGANVCMRQFDVW